jgi:hypothetical protein
MPYRKFNRELLDVTLARDNATLDETKELPDPLNVKSRISYICACGIPHEKIFEKLVDGGGARCESCAERERQLKIKATTQKKYGVSSYAHIRGRAFNRDLLDVTLARDNATLDETKELPDPLNIKSRISYICACGIPYAKDFWCLVDRGGARCESCTEGEKQLKMKATTQKNHGVSNCSHIQGQAFNRELLDVTLARDNATLDETKKLPTRLNRDSHISYICPCGTPHTKVFREIVERGGARCESCTEHERLLKARATCKERYDCEYPLQNSGIFDRAQKSMSKRKNYTTPSGHIWSLQGYEHLVAPKLITEYGEDNISHGSKQVPRILWTDSTNVRHRYYCDFYIKSHRIIIEVKSKWTESKDAEKIVATREAANALGYGYRLIVIDKGDWIRDEFSPSIIGAEGKKPIL